MPKTTAAELERRVRALGPMFNPAILEATRGIYQPYVDMTPAREETDLAYGPHARHRLDVYLPAGHPSAVVLFVHGGGFTGGDKNEGGTFYVNLGRFLARHGFAAVLANYRRAPECGWPAAAHDVRDAVAWVRDQAPTVLRRLPLFVWGQSAGAAHVATWLFDEETRGTPLGPIAGVILTSGYYHPVAPMAPGIRAYFGEDEAQYPRRSALLHVSATAVPLWLSVAELDPGEIAARTFELAARIARVQGRAPEFAWLRGHNHVSTVLSLGSPQTDVADAVLSFLRTRLAQAVEQ